MKTLSGRFRFVVFGAIVTVAVAGCINFPYVPDIISWCMEIENKQRADGPYVEWKDEGTFKKALEQVRGHNGEYCLCVMMTSDDKPHPYDSYNKCPQGYKCPSGKIRTVKVTKSKAADTTGAGESAVNDPHITYRVSSPYPGDLIKVLDALKK
jgi:hypothetical protein